MKKKLLHFLSIFVILALWQTAAVLLNSQLIFPSVSATVSKLFELLKTQTFYKAIAISCARVFMGFLLAATTGLFAGILCGRFKSLRVFMEFPLALIRSVPVVSFILLAIFVFSSDFVPVFCTFLMGFPIMTDAVCSAFSFSSEEEKLFFMADVFKLTKPQRFRYIFLPHFKPFFKSGILSVFGLSWKVTAASEVLSIPKNALGAILQNAQVHLETSTVLAATSVLVALSFFSEKLILILFDSTFKFLTSIQKAKKRLLTQNSKQNEKTNILLSPVPVVLKNLTIQKGKKILFSNFNCTFESGKTTAILAPSGSGKTTLLNYIAQCQKSVSFLFQEPCLLPSLTVFENVLLPLLNVYESKTAFEQTQKYLRLTQLYGRKDDNVRNLSGGEKQRVAMARSFAFPSQILLLDEAFQSLDAKIKTELEETLKQLLSQTPRTVIFVTHEKEEALKLADTILELEGEPLSLQKVTPYGDFQAELL